MSSVRAFIALEIPQEVRENCAQFIRALQQEIRHGVRWEPVEKIHLTIKFLGDIPTKDISRLRQILDNLAQNHASFEVGLQGLGVFPRWNAPRVIWLGMERTSALVQLQQDIEKGANALGYPSEKRSFSPHLTLGRVQQTIIPEEAARIGEIIKTHTDLSIGTIFCDTVTLFQSTLKPSGSVYTSIHTVNLFKKV